MKNTLLLCALLSLLFFCKTKKEMDYLEPNFTTLEEQTHMLKDKKQRTGICVSIESPILSSPSIVSKRYKATFLLDSEPKEKNTSQKLVIRYDAYQLRKQIEENKSYTIYFNADQTIFYIKERS